MTYSGACCTVSQRSSPLHQHRWGGLASVVGLRLPLSMEDAWNLLRSLTDGLCHNVGEAQAVRYVNRSATPVAASVRFKLLWQHRWLLCRCEDVHH